MTAVNQTCDLYRGDTATLFIAVTAADGTPLDQSLDVVYRYRMAPTRHTPDSKTLIRKEQGAGLVPVPGGVAITLSTVDTDQAPGVYYHELKTYNAGDVSTAMVGAFIIRHALQLGVAVVPRSAALGIVRGSPSRAP